MTPLLMTETTTVRGGTAASANDETVPMGDGEFADLVDASATQVEQSPKPTPEPRLDPEAVVEESGVLLAMAPPDGPVPPGRSTGDTVAEGQRATLTKAPDITKETGQVAPKTETPSDEKPVEGKTPGQPEKNTPAVKSAVQAIVEGRMPQPQADQGLKPVPRQAGGVTAPPQAAPLQTATLQAGTPQDDAPEREVVPRVPASQTTDKLLQRQGLQAPTAEQAIAVPSEPKSVRGAERREAREKPMLQTVEVTKQPSGPPAPAVTTPVLASAPTIMLDLQKQATNQTLAEVDIVSGSGVGERAVASGAQAGATGPSPIASPQGQQVAHQITAAITQSGGRATEISLNPEELGRVRLSMTSHETTITLTVLAERPETTDLLRRNIDALAQEFRALGYDDINFSFGGGDAAQTDTDDANDQPSLIGELVEDDLTPTALQPTSGLDLRM